MSQNVNVFHARFFCHTTLIKIAFFLLLNSTGIELRTQKYPRHFPGLGMLVTEMQTCLQPSAYLLVFDLGFVLTPTYQIKKTRQQLERGKVYNINTMKSLPR